MVLPCILVHYKAVGFISAYRLRNQGHVCTVRLLGMKLLAEKLDTHCAACRSIRITGICMSACSIV